LILMSDPNHPLLPLPLSEIRKRRKPVRNVNTEQKEQLSGLDKLALFITQHVGSMGFFLIILTWTVLWTGYNLLATEVPSLGWKSFDPFPAFVAYLLISNVIQILLMPLIMVGQNVQSQHADLRAENDFQINIKAEKEVETVLKHLEYQNTMLLSLCEKQGIKQEQIIKQLEALASDS
jgi:uncharacterized membrane protein